MKPAATTLPESGAVVIGYSQEENPITVTVVSPQKTPKRTMLIMGAIHGDEPEGPAFLEHLIDYYASPPKRPQYTRLALMPVTNPDGLEKGTRQNARGVDLNRNFPTKDWEDTKRLLEMYEEYDIEPSYENPEAYYYGGPEAASEPETRAVMALFENNMFNAAIELHSTRTHTSCPEGVVNDGKAEELTQVIAEASNMPLSINGVGYPTPGSLGLYISSNYATPSVTIEFRNGWNKKEVVDYGWDGILAGIQFIDKNE